MRASAGHRCNKLRPIAKFWYTSFVKVYIYAKLKFDFGISIIECEIQVNDDLMFAQPWGCADIFCSAGASVVSTFKRPKRGVAASKNIEANALSHRSLDFRVYCNNRVSSQ